jgi:NAD(P)-dependent dehydrogenase (short-subunit alcohol dehydrogenase family)
MRGGRHVLDGKICLVTGAATGIGRATAVEMARQGAAAVVVADIDAGGGEETIELARAEGAKGAFVSTDASDPAQIRELIARTDELFGGLDVLHNNVGVLEASFTDQLTIDVLPEEVWERVYQVNLRSYFLTIRYAAALLKRSTRGPNIVNTASVSGLVAYPMGPAYAATKGGVIQLTKATAVDLAPTVRCNCFCPAATETSMMLRYLDVAEDPATLLKMMTATHLVGRAGRPDDMAKLVCFLASDDASFINGGVYVIDGGSLAWRGSNDG